MHSPVSNISSHRNLEGEKPGMSLWCFWSLVWLLHHLLLSALNNTVWFIYQLRPEVWLKTQTNYRLTPAEETCSLSLLACISFRVHTPDCISNIWMNFYIKDQVFLDINGHVLSSKPLLFHKLFQSCCFFRSNWLKMCDALGSGGGNMEYCLTVALCGPFIYNELNI